MEKIIILAKNGELDKIFRGGNVDQIKNIASLIELDISSIPFSNQVLHGYEDIEKKYQEWGKFGPFGDIIQVSVDQYAKQPGTSFSSIDFIGRLAYPKPGMAADLVPIIEDAEGNRFFIGIVRKNPPGQGKPALIGGFLNIDGYHLETPAEALLHEADEEASFSIIPFDQEEKQRIYHDPDADTISVYVTLGPHKIHTIMERLGCFQTSDAEKLEHLGIKKVYETTAYGLIIRVEQVLTKKILSQWLKAGDDAQGIVICNLDKEDTPDFAIGHHKIIFARALDQLKI